MSLFLAHVLDIQLGKVTINVRKASEHNLPFFFFFTFRPFLKIQNRPHPPPSLLPGDATTGQPVFGLMVGVPEPSVDMGTLIVSPYPLPPPPPPLPART